MSDKLPSNPTAKIHRIYEVVSLPAPLLLHVQEQEHKRRQEKMKFFLYKEQKQGTKKTFRHISTRRRRSKNVVQTETGARAESAIEAEAGI